MSYDQLPPGPVNPYLIDAMVTTSQKSLLLAYIFWYFGGVFGIHNFYLGKPLLGALQAASLPCMMAVLQIAEWIGTENLAGKAVGLFGIAIFAVLAVSLLIDAFLIPRRARAYSERMRAQLEAEADWQAA
jgi:hypothetical protein